MLSKTAKRLGDKCADQPYILGKISSFQNSIAQKSIQYIGLTFPEKANWAVSV